MKKIAIVMALVCGFVAQTNCLLTEKLAAVSSKIAVVRTNVKAGKLTVNATCGEGGGHCKSGCVKA